MIDVKEEIENLGNVSDNWSLLREILKEMLPKATEPKATKKK